MRSQIRYHNSSPRPFTKKYQQKNSSVIFSPCPTFLSAFVLLQHPVSYRGPKSVILRRTSVSMTENLASPNSADWSRSSAPCNFNTEPKNAHLQKERSLPNPIDTSWKLTLFTHNCKVCESSESATERLLLVLG